MGRDIYGGMTTHCLAPKYGNAISFWLHRGWLYPLPSAVGETTEPWWSRRWQDPCSLQN